MLDKYKSKITALIRKKVGEDDFHNPVYQWEDKVVNDVLIRPLLSEDVTKESNRQEGHVITHKLYIPKNCNLDFENAIVIFGNIEYKVIGAPVSYPKVPDVVNTYNRVVKVGRENG